MRTRPDDVLLRSREFRPYLGPSALREDEVDRSQVGGSGISKLEFSHADLGGR